jgi:carboxypeptidase C (cathepsin A)
MGRYVPGFVSAFHQMLSEDLKVREDRRYGAIVWRNLLFGWNWKRTGVPEGQSFAGDLATAMRRNGDLKVLVASGYYDMVTTPAAAQDALTKAGAPTDRLTMRNYESGHMLYLGDTAAAFSDDVRALIQDRRR